MNRLRSKLTYANVVASLCLVLLVGGGTAIAAGGLEKESVGTRQLKKESVTPLKLSKNSKAALTGPQGAPGAPGAAGATGSPGPAGSALAFARIDENGAVDGAQSKGIGGMTVTKVGTGEYCISNLPFAPKNVVANAQFFARGVNTFVGTFSKCPVGTQVSYETWTSGANSNSAVMILFN